MVNQPLSGLRVIEMAVWWAGPQCTRLLGELGAEVIKIESLKHIDHTRGELRPRPGSGVYPNRESGSQPYNRAGTFNERNRNKLDITLDLACPEAKDIFIRLVQVSDVLVVNFAAGVMDGLGLGYPTLRKVNPSLVMISMPAFGMTGPEKDYVGLGNTIEAIVGIPSINGYRDGIPMKSGTNIGDPISGVMGAGAVLAAVHHRAKTGQGQFIDFSQSEVLAHFIPEPILDYTINGRIRGGTGNRHSSMAPHGCYRCQGDDEWLAIAVGSDEEWRALCQTMGKPELAGDERFVDVLARHKHQDELDSLIEEWTVGMDHREAMRLLQSRGVTAAAVHKNRELFEDPHLGERAFFIDVSHPAAGTHLLAGMPYKLSNTPLAIRHPAPCLGEHNEYVLGELLGMPAKEIEALEESRIIGKTPVM